MPLFLLSLLSWFKSKFFNVKTILFTGLGLLITIRMLWLKLQVNKKNKQLKKLGNIFEAQKELEELENKKKTIQSGKPLKNRFPK